MLFPNEDGAVHPMNVRRQVIVRGAVETLHAHMGRMSAAEMRELAALLEPYERPGWLTSVSLAALHLRVPECEEEDNLQVAQDEAMSCLYSEVIESLATFEERLDYEQRTRALLNEFGAACGEPPPDPDAPFEVPRIIGLDYPSDSLDDQPGV